jgi:dolichol-phosphate mannosyltransferase
MTTSLIVPCFNEADGLRRLEEELWSVVADLTTRGDVDIVFVDDGSRDETPALLASLAERWSQRGVLARVVTHPVNQGLGSALRSGFLAARGDIIVTTDSDATYPFAEIPRLLDVLDRGADLVTASPYHPDGGVMNVPPSRLILSRGASTLYRAVLGRDVHTYTALFRGYRREVLTTVGFDASGFLSATELLVNAVLAGFRVAEFPTVLHARRFGSSKAKLARTVLAHLGLLAHLVVMRVRREGRINRGRTPVLAATPRVSGGLAMSPTQGAQ